MNDNCLISMSFSSAQDKICGQPWHKVLPYYYFGGCFVVQFPRCVQEAGILEVNFRFISNKTDFFVNHQNQFLSSNSRSRGSVLKGGFTRAPVIHEVVNLLSDEFNECEFNVTFDKCILDNIYEMSMEQIGCTTPWMFNKSNICTVGKL